MNKELNPIIHQDEIFSNIVNVGSEFNNRQFFNCIFKGCQFKQCRLGSSDFVNCHFINCDLYLVNVTRSGFRNVLFSDCKIIGIDFSQCNKLLFSFEFSNCKLDYSNFYEMWISLTKFKNCSLKNVDFRGADLSASLFENCDLTGAKFENSILEKTDFRSAYNFKIDPNLNRIKKALFSDSNLFGLLYRFDIDIRESKSYCEVILDSLMLSAF